MIGKAAKYSICMFLAAVLLLKATTSLVLVFSTYSSKMTFTEWLMEHEQEEKKNNNRAENGADELFEKALLPDCDYTLMKTEKPLLHIGAESLQDVHLDTLTPPPNAILS